jgi:phthiodiolone/phenolphthiodiolone dimycocerosates ketoreductase
LEEAQGAIMRVSVGLGVVTNYRLAELRQLLRYARLMGADCFLVSDHWQDFLPRALWDPTVTWRADRAGSPHEYRESFTSLGSLAHLAGRVRIGTAVTEVVRRHPVMVAQAAMTLAELTSKPPILGIGAGESLNVDPYGLGTPTPVSRLDEGVHIIRRCFEPGEAFDFVGRHFTLDNARMDICLDSDRRPEIWLAGHGPNMLRMTGRLADGWIPSSAPVGGPADYDVAWKTVRDAAEAAGRDPECITPSLYAYILVAASSRSADSLARSTLARYLALAISPATWWQEMGLDHPLGHTFRGYVDVEPEAIDDRRLAEAIDSVPAELVRSCYLIGTPRQIEDRIREYSEVGLRHVVLAPVSALVSRRDQTYALWAVANLIRRLASR